MMKKGLLLLLFALLLAGLTACQPYQDTIARSPSAAPAAVHFFVPVGS